MTEYNLGKIWKTDPPRRPKKCISRGFLHEVLSNGLNRVNTNSLTYVDCVAKLACKVKSWTQNWEELTTY